VSGDLFWWRNNSLAAYPPKLLALENVSAAYGERSHDPYLGAYGNCLFPKRRHVPAATLTTAAALCIKTERKFVSQQRGCGSTGPLLAFRIRIYRARKQKVR